VQGGRIANRHVRADGQEGAMVEQQQRRWKQDPEAVRSDILRVATEEFAKAGLAGARMDEIAARTRTSKRMIYYYFGDKEGLYRAVLEQTYRDMRVGEQALQLEDLPPEEALRALVVYSFDHHWRNANFIRLVMTENMHEGAYMQVSGDIQRLNASAIDRVRQIYERGRAAGVFRDGIDPLKLHWIISGLSFFNRSNFATFGLIFGPTLFEPKGQAALRAEVVEVVLRYVLAER
jgi:AcrR family transcriptional regulator